MYFNLDHTDSVKVTSMLVKMCEFVRDIDKPEDDAEIYDRMTDLFGPPILTPAAGADPKSMFSASWKFNPDNRWDYLFGTLFIRTEREAVFARMRGAY